MEELIGGGGNLEVINLDKNEGTVRPFQAPDQIDAILMLERATGVFNCTQQTFNKVGLILGGTQAKDSMILMITDIMNAEEENIQGRIDEAIMLQLGGYFRWESVKLSPEEIRQQTKDFFDLVKTIKPFTNDFLKRQKERVNELTFKLMNEEKYFKKEPYIKEVERWVECLEEVEEVVGVSYDTQTKELLAKATAKYNEELDKKFNNNKLQKYSMVAAESIYSLGLIPATSIIKYASQIQEETKTVVYQKRQETRLRKVMEKEEAWRVFPPSFQEMLPVARKMVKDQVKHELADYLRLQQGFDLEHNAPDR